MPKESRASGNTNIQHLKETLDLALEEAQRAFGEEADIKYIGKAKLSGFDGRKSFVKRFKELTGSDNNPPFTTEESLVTVSFDSDREVYCLTINEEHFGGDLQEIGRQINAYEAFQEVLKSRGYGEETWVSKSYK